MLTKDHKSKQIKNEEALFARAAERIAGTKPGQARQ
jgi:hypothetical protein